MLRELIGLTIIIIPILVSGQAWQSHVEDLYENYEQVPDSIVLSYLSDQEAGYASLNEEEKALYHWVKGYRSYEAFNMDSSLYHLHQCIPYLTRVQEFESLAELYNIIGQVHMERSDENAGTASYYKSIQISKKHGLYESLGNSYLSLADMYYYIGDLEMTRSSLKEAKNAFGKAGVGIGDNLIAIGEYAINDIPKSEISSTIQGVIDEITRTGDFENVVFVNIIRTEKFLNHDLIDSALHYSKHTMALAEFHQLETYQHMATGQYARILAEQSQYGEAKNILFSLLENYEDHPDHESSAYFALNEIYLAEGKTDSAYVFLSAYHEIIEEQEKLTSARSLSDINLKFENEQQLEEIKAQKRLRNLIYTFGGLLLLVSTGFYLWYYQRQKLKKQAAEQALLLEQEKAENLRQLDALKDQFFTNISHELKTPLTLIKDPLGRLIKEPNSADSQKDISLAHRNSERLLSMVNEIMDLSKLEAGKMEAQNSSFHLTPLVKRVIYAFDSLACTRNIKIEFCNEMTSKLPIYSDPSHIEKIINNLVSNAIKFSPNEGLIKCSVLQRQDKIHIQVQDQGAGISIEDQKNIFDRFYQGKQGKSYQGGTGVGLALSKELSILLGGQLQVESKLGEGSIFTLILPQTIVEENEALDFVNLESDPETIIPYKPLTINGKKPKLLIIEDNPDMSSYLERILSEYHTITIAKNGIEGLQKLQTDNYNLIVSDVMMPGMDGFTLRKKIIDLFGMNATPYIFLTARSLEEDILNGLRLGVDDYITKPFNSEELKIRIDNLIRNNSERKASLHMLSAAGEDLEQESERILKNAERHVFENMSDPNYNVSSLAQDMTVSAKHLNRILKPLTGLTPVAFLLELRLSRARQLLEKGIYTSLSEVRFEVGIESASYFSRKYKGRYGMSPSEAIKRK